VDDYARHSLAASATLGLWRNVFAGARSDCKRKVDGRGYCGVDLRAGWANSRLELFVEAANVFDVRYQEVIGVDMPPRWILAGVRAGR
jgi:outer membrane receptor protein involved in Fe transport